MNHMRITTPIGLRIGVLLSCIALPLLVYMPDYLLTPRPAERGAIIAQLTPKLMLETTIPALILLYGVAFAYLRAMRQRFSDIGLRFKRWPAQFATGVALALLLIVASMTLSAVARAFAGSEGFARFAGQMSGMLENRVWLAAWIFTAIARGGIVEETLRAYVLTRCEFAFGGYGLSAALIVSSVIFGMMHGYEGSAAVFAAGGLGLVLGLIFIRRRSLIEVVVAHAVYDLAALGALYVIARYNLPIA